VPENSDFWVGPFAAPETYELVAELGSGGEGQVWKGVVSLSEAGRRWVAIKILPGTGSAEEEEQWKRFGHLLMSLSHPGLVRVTEVFTGPPLHRQGVEPAQGTMRYVVMDFVEGDTLREWIVDHPDANVAGRILQLRTVASALDEMHSGKTTEVPVSHGDVKPENIIVRSSGGTILVDLGLARLSDGTGVTGRTNPYAAPELHEIGGQATPDTDSFAFVATLAHVLTGQQPPLDPEGRLDLAELDRQLAASPVTSNRPALVEHIHNALAAAPEARPHQLSVWLNAITATLSQLTGPAAQTILGSPRSTPTGPASGADPDSPHPAKRRGVAVLAGIFTAVVLLIGGGSYVAGQKLSNAEAAPQNQSPATTVTLTAPASTVATTVAKFSTMTVTATPTASESTAVSTPVSSGSASAATTGSVQQNSTTFDLSSVQPVDEYDYNGSGKPVSVSGTIYTSNIQVSSSTDSHTFAEYDLGRKWKTLNVDVGFADTDKADTQATFQVLVDGAGQPAQNLTFGQTAHMTVPVDGALRVRLDTIQIQGRTNGGILVWMNPVASR